MVAILKLAIASYFAVVVFMYLMQSSLLYFPTEPVENIDEQTLEFNNEEVTLRGWVINPGQAKAILYYGGNGEEIDRNVRLFKRKFADYSVYLVNYRGYGRSTGKPTEAGLFSDALAIYDQIKANHKSANSTISAIGRSLGTGVATYVAANRPISHLVLVTPYDSIANVAQQKYPLLPVSWLLTDKYESWRLTEQISAKTLVLIAEFDQIVPPEHGEKLVSHFTRHPQSDITKVIIAEAKHNDISAYSEYSKTIARFLMY
ncbi:MAG: pimeloyl-ACP methyl ester carboxylesterase [Phenylobacterium sp.]|jgi:pimeloyl-ACP methyl ester carboxylesterase